MVPGATWPSSARVPPDAECGEVGCRCSARTLAADAGGVEGLADAVAGEDVGCGVAGEVGVELCVGAVACCAGQLGGGVESLVVGGVVEVGDVVVPGWCDRSSVEQDGHVVGRVEVVLTPTVRARNVEGRTFLPLGSPLTRWR